MKPIDHKTSLAVLSLAVEGPASLSPLAANVLSRVLDSHATRSAFGELDADALTFLTAAATRAPESDIKARATEIIRTDLQAKLRA